MEQILFESDQRSAKNTAKEYFDRDAYLTSYENGIQSGIEKGFEMGCEHKNNQMQEFLLWLYPSNWVIYQNDKGLYFENIELGRTALFQEVFEIFIKETSDGKN